MTADNLESAWWTRSMTLPNCITFFRFLLVPLFVFAIFSYHKSLQGLAFPLEKYWWFAVSTFVVAALSDGLDGFIARYFHMKSRLGTFLDPLADKALLLAGFFALSFLQVDAIASAPIPLWLACLILAKDILLIAGVAWARFNLGYIEVKPHWTSKISTFLQMAAIASALFRMPRAALTPLLYLTTFFILLSTLIYIFQGLALFKEKQSKA